MAVRLIAKLLQCHAIFALLELNRRRCCNLLRSLLFRSNWALSLPKTNAWSPTIFCDELDAGLLEGGRYCVRGIL